MQERHSSTASYAIDTAVLTHTSGDKSRQLGSLEQLFWLTDQHRTVHFALAAEVEGKTSRGAWRDALDRLQERHPLLSVRIAGDDGGIPRFQRVDGAPLPLRVVDADKSSGFEAEIEAELAIPFDPDQAPLARAVLIHGPEKATLIFVAHHAIADGMSVAYLIRDTLNALAGERLEALPLAPSVDELFAANHPAAKTQSATERQEEAPAVTPSTYRPDDGARPKVQGLQLSQALTERLRERARQEATTVHGALVAAFAIAGRTASDDWRDIPVRVVSPINVRQTLGIGENCGVYLSAAPTVFEPVLADFWDLARHARESVERGRPPEAMGGRGAHGCGCRHPRGGRVRAHWICARGVSHQSGRAAIRQPLRQGDAQGAVGTSGDIGPRRRADHRGRDRGRRAPSAAHEPHPSRWRTARDHAQRIAGGGVGVIASIGG